MSHTILLGVVMTEPQLVSAFEAAAECGLVMLKDKNGVPRTKMRVWGGKFDNCVYVFDVPEDKRKNHNEEYHYQPGIVRIGDNAFRWAIESYVGRDPYLTEMAGPSCRHLLQKTGDKHSRLVAEEFGYEAVQREVLENGTIDLLFDVSLGQQIADNLLMS